MPKKAGRRVQIKRILNKKGFIFRSRPLSSLYKTPQSYKWNKSTTSYGKLKPIKFEIEYPNYKLIKKNDFSFERLPSKIL